MNIHNRISPFVFLIGILVLIAGFWLYIHFYLKPSSADVPKITIGGSVISGSISSGNVVYTNEETSVNITYPDSGYILNAALKDVIALEVRAYEKARKEAGCAEVPTACENYDLVITIEAIDKEPLASFLMKASMYTGGAHGGYHEQGLVFDESGIQLELSDLFQGEYLVMFSDVSRQQLAASYKARDITDIDDMLFEGTEPREENFSSFYIQQGLVVLVFSPYQVGPWVLGMQYAVIPFDYLDGYVKKDYLALYDGIVPPSIILLSGDYSVYREIYTKGFARTFESNVSLMFESNGMKIATATTAFAPDIGFYGYFEHTFPVSLLKAKKEDVVIRHVVDQSAQDGSDIIRYTDEFTVEGL